jgi:hypothetical protein
LAGLRSELATLKSVREAFPWHLRNFGRVQFRHLACRSVTTVVGGDSPTSLGVVPRGSPALLQGGDHRSRAGGRAADAAGSGRRGNNQTNC